MALLASVLAFVCFLAACIVMIPEVEDMDWLGSNLSATMFGALGFSVLAGTVLASRKKEG